ncbi:MAG TPA: GNAT family N-acetyltransferase [Amycolatopsis sp.]|uniref:GNAT family N-acetyltransferase n=1 Tax=Amycolatopsis sp. TaxID=37632 RepID=UPI002B45941F|nr:GNAT family N-acetyltransferase [Amycolatopsis sp.]HKS47122.1 GNAT family N-acetyltransferase [Amycolatopsis sp.]
MNGARIRHAELADAHAVFELVCQFAVSYRPHRALFDQHYELVMAAMTYDGTDDLLVAEDADVVIGYALAGRFLTFYANGPVSELRELMVAPAHRGRGVGRQLVEAVIARARAAGAAEVVVTTRRAKDYYRKLGFEETATLLKLSLV